MDEKEAEARPVMGTIFLVYYTNNPNCQLGNTNNWASEASPTLGRFRVILCCRYVSYVKLTA